MLFPQNLCKFRLEPSDGADDFDQKVIDSVEQFVPARSELIEVFASIAQYDSSITTATAIHKFFESLIDFQLLIGFDFCFR